MTFGILSATPRLVCSRQNPKCHLPGSQTISRLPQFTERPSHEGMACLESHQGLCRTWMLKLGRSEPYLDSRFEHDHLGRNVWNTPIMPWESVSPSYANTRNVFEFSLRPVHCMWTHRNSKGTHRKRNGIHPPLLGCLWAGWIFGLGVSGWFLNGFNNSLIVY